MLLPHKIALTRKAKVLENNPIKAPNKIKVSKFNRSFFPKQKKINRIANTEPIICDMPKAMLMDGGSNSMCKKSLPPKKT